MTAPHQTYAVVLSCRTRTQADAAALGQALDKLAVKLTQAQLDLLGRASERPELVKQAFAYLSSVL